jgi:methylase of polypeptide subunit release factors
MGKMIGHMTGTAICYSIWLGDELGLYRELADSGPRTADSVAEKTGCHARLVREWLDGQAAGGLVAYDADSDTYELHSEAAMALSDDSSPVFVARAMNTFGSMFIDMQKTAAAFRGDGALSWGDHHPCLFSGTEWFFRTGYRAYLTNSWIPALEGVEEKLKAGAHVADVGCGHGASLVAMATVYQNSKFFGFDFHAPSIETCVKRAHEAGVSQRAQFKVATATTYSGKFDLICFFEPFALDPRPKNIAENPMASLFYVASSCICAPNSLSQEGGFALGAQAGETKLREVFKEAGFSYFKRAAQTPTNLVIEVRV